MECNGTFYRASHTPEHRYGAATPRSRTSTISPSVLGATSQVSLGSTIENIAGLTNSFSRTAHGAPSEALATLGGSSHLNETPPTAGTTHPQENSWNSQYASSTASSQSDTSHAVLANFSRSAGQRVESVLPRGVYLSPGEGGAQWHLAISTIIGYRFSNPDLLEEALESPDSGVMCVGGGKRQLGREGNEGLAGMGFIVGELVLGEEGYTMKMGQAKIAQRIAKVLGRENLDRLGRVSKMEHFVRRKRGDMADRKGLWSLLKEDIKGEDPSITVARAVRAILGAVYFDGGLEEVRKVMKGLGLVIEG